MTALASLNYFYQLSVSIKSCISAVGLFVWNWYGMTWLKWLRWQGVRSHISNQNRAKSREGRKVILLVVGDCVSSYFHIELNMFL